MKKQEFDDSFSEQALIEEKKEETQVILEEFENFVDEPIPDEVEAYSWEDNFYLIKVFQYKDKGIEDKFQVNQKNNQAYSSNTRHFSLAKILACGENSDYEPGDIVKLKDQDTLTVESSKYRNWKENKYSKGNAKQIGEEPPRFVCNIYSAFSGFTFVLNPLNLANLDIGQEDEGLYKIPGSKIENKVKDVDILFDTAE